MHRIASRHFSTSIASRGRPRGPLSAGDAPSPRLDGVPRRGVAAIEAAFVLSVFVVLLFVMLDVGLMALDYNLMCNGAQQLCREAMVHGSMAGPQATSWGPTAIAGNAADGSQYSQAFQGVLGTLSPGSVDYTLQWPNGSNQPDSAVQATLTYQYNPMVPYVFGSQPVSLQAVCTMAIDH
jgi:Flp pilus assembly protein TadG